MHWTRVVFLDGIMVPTLGVQCSWTSKGVAQAAISLVPSARAEQILPSTHVHVFHLEAGLANRYKIPVDLGNPDFIGDRSMYAEESARTVGDVFFPALNLAASDGRGQLSLLAGMPYHGFHLRFAGEVASLSKAEAAKQAPAVTLNCRGYDHLMDLVTAIQLTRGAGTLADEERRFFGQHDPVFVGQGRRAFFDGMAELLANSEYGLAETCRRLASVYPARLNKWAAHRFAWTRLADQLCSVDRDTSVARLLDTDAFRRYLRETIQSSYTLPLRAAIQKVLDFPMHRMISVPTPAFFPLYARSGATAAPTERTTQTEVRGSTLVAEVSVPELTYYPFPVGWDIPGHENYGGSPSQEISPETGESFWEWVTATVRIPLEPVTLSAATVQGTFSDNNRQLQFRLGDGINGGPASYGFRIDDAIVRAANNATSVAPQVAFDDAFLPNRTYLITSSDLSPTAGSHYPPRTLTITVVTSTRPRRVRTEVESVPVPPVTPPQPEGLSPSTWARLGSYAIVPHLWWACPPACNIVIPDEIKQLTFDDPGIDKPTRLLAKIAPGRSGASTVFIDRFSAPNERQLNESAGDPTDHPRDPETLYRPEYISGPRADVYYFETLHRLVRDEDYEPYLRSFINAEFWNRRLGSRQAVLTMRLSIRPVTGAPMLIITGTAGSADGFQTPTQIHWLARIAALEQMRRNLQRRRSSLSGNSGTAERLRRQLQGLFAIRAFVESARGSEVVSSTIRDIEGGRQSVSYVSRLIINESANNLIDLRASGIHDLLAGSSNAYVGSPVIFDATQVRQLITTDAELAGNTLTTEHPNPYPTLGQLRRWYDEISQNVSDPSACRSALQRDIDRLGEAIAAARAALREEGIVAAEVPAYLGYVENVTEGAGPQSDQMSVALTHVRRLGEDLDWDGLSGDDPEALIAFGEQGYMDPRYKTGRIGPEVYLPLYGCASVAETEEARRSTAVEAVRAGVEGLPPIDGADVRASFEHPTVCGSDYSGSNEGPDGTAGMNALTACKAIVGAYTDLVNQGARSETLFDWLEGVRARATCSVADVYRGMPALLGQNEGDTVATDLTRDDAAAYPDGTALRGFFASSFLAGDMDYERVAVVALTEDGTPSDVDVVDDEKDLLAQRVERVREYVASLADKSYARQS